MVPDVRRNIGRKFLPEGMEGYMKHLAGRKLGT